jgi:hypothetical protein
VHDWMADDMGVILLMAQMTRFTTQFNPHAFGKSFSPMLRGAALQVYVEAERTDWPKWKDAFATSSCGSTIGPPIPGAPDMAAPEENRS